MIMYLWINNDTAIKVTTTAEYKLLKLHLRTTNLLQYIWTLGSWCFQSRLDMKEDLS